MSNQKQRRELEVQVPPPALTSNLPQSFVNFALWLKRKGNRESTIERKIRYITQLSTLDPSEVFQKHWTDKVKKNALDVLADYAKFLGLPFDKPLFKVYDNREMYVPTPEMVKQVNVNFKNLATSWRAYPSRSNSLTLGFLRYYVYQQVYACFDADLSGWW